MRKLLLIAVLTLSLSLIVGVALTAEGDIIEEKSLTEAKPSDFIALGTTVKRVIADFEDEFRNSWGLEAGELDLEEGKIIYVEGIPSPILFAPVKGDKIQAFAYLPDNELTFGREAMGIILEIVEGKKMTIKIEGREFEMDLETGKTKVIGMKALGGYWECMGKCLLDKAPGCAGPCLICVADPTKITCVACLTCAAIWATYCGIKCW